MTVTSFADLETRDISLAMKMLESFWRNNSSLCVVHFSVLKLEDDAML
jgi:hypothetical protein